MLESLGYNRKSNRAPGYREALGYRFWLRFMSFGLVAVVAGCSTGNSRWSQVSDAENTKSVSRYSGESSYSDTYLLRRDLAEDNPLLFQIDDSVQIHAEDLMTRLEVGYLLKAGGALDWGVAADTLEGMLFDTLVSLAADTFDLREDSASWGDYTLVRDGLLGRTFFEEAIYGKTPLDSLEVDSFYHSRSDIFSYFPQINVGHIVLSREGYRSALDSAKYIGLPDDELDSLIYTRLRFLKEAVTDSTMFEQFASEYSQDRRTGPHGGRLGWVEQYNLHPEIEDVLYGEDIPLYEVIGPLESRDGVHLFFMYDRHREGIPPLNADRYEQAHNYLLGSRAKIIYGGLRDSLRSAHPSSYDDSALAFPSGGIDGQTPVAWASGIDTVRFITYDRARIMVAARLPASQVLTVGQLRSVAQGEIDRRLALAMAEEAGMDENPTFKKESQREYHSFARAAIYRQSRDPQYLPSDSEIEKYFLAHKLEYVSPKPVKIQQIVFEDSLEAEFVRALAESGEDFLELADEYYPGDTAIRRDAADLGFIGPDDFDKNIFQRAMQISVGDVTVPIRTQYGYHVVKVVDIRREISIAEKRSSIITILIEAHDQEVKRIWRSDMLTNHNVTIAPVRYKGVVMGPVENRSYMPGEILPDELKNSGL